MSEPVGEWAADADTQRSEDEAPAAVFENVDQWVREFFVNAYRRTINGRTRKWAADWWMYPEATARLDALWRAWEYLRRDPALGMSLWWRDHVDPHMAALLDPEGPFAAIEESDSRHHCRRGERLPVDPAPEGLFDPPDALLS